MSEETMNLVMVILAIGAAATPMLIAYLIVQLTKYFTPKNEFAALKEQLAREHADNRQYIDELRADVKTLIRQKPICGKI